MSRIVRNILFGVSIGLAGILCGLVPPVHSLEENLGLAMLFRLRGQRQPPPEVVIVSMDKESSEILNTSSRPEKWPRNLHAELVDHLSEKGARIIVFDVFFGEPSTPEDDRAFAEALRKAQNVVLVERIQKEKIVFDEKQGSRIKEVEIEKLMHPFTPLAEASAETSPFPLPKIDAKVHQYWTFKPSAGGIPTLPVTAFQIYSSDAYSDFLALLQTYSVPFSRKFPPDKDALLSFGHTSHTAMDLKELFYNNPDIADKLTRTIGSSDKFSSADKNLLLSLIHMYDSPSSRYLNFYGYPHTIPTVPYWEVIHARENPSDEQNRFDFTGKAVFIGSSEYFQPEQRDGFYTVFTRSDGLDISGVEIAATAFANILEAKPVSPLPFTSHLAIVFLWGTAAGMCCRYFPGIKGVFIVVLAGIIYFFFTLRQFTSAGTWYPVVIPLFFQGPAALLCSFICTYVTTSRERRNIREAFSYYLPDDVVERISNNIAKIGETYHVAYGTCLYTDAEQYTTLSETMGPEELSRFMNRYYESVFGPVRRNGGIISNIIGDAMLAIWVTENPDVAARKNACLAALEINNSSDTMLLPTRIALHSGQISLGNIGAGGHYEYRPVGDIVNTTTRLEGLNKVLGTRILMSEDVVLHLDGFLTREVGTFLLPGKKHPVAVHELIGSSEHVTRQQRYKCATFCSALETFRKGSWKEASEIFDEVIRKFGDDSPSLFYINKCRQYQENPLEAHCEGIICFDKK